MTLVDIESPLCDFPKEDWDPRFDGADKEWPAAKDVFLNLIDLSLPAPSELAHGHEHLRLMHLKHFRSVVRDTIRKQAQSPHHAIQPVLDVVGLHIDKRPDLDWKEMRRLIIANVTPVIFSYKVKFNRGRPWNCLGPALDAMFQRPDALYPGHPSYPSGHATLAYTFAYFLARLYPNATLALMTEAAGAAFNREVAGVHFASDSEAGRLLAKQMVEAMFDAKLNPNHGDFTAAVNALKLS